MFASVSWLFPLLAAATMAGVAAPYWHEVPAAAQRRLGKPRLPATRYRVLRLDLPAVRRLLQQAPAEGPAPTLLALPLPDGSMHQFRVQRAQVMAPELQARFPDLLSFAGRDVADPTADLRLNLTPAGLRAQIIGYGSTFFIEPYRRDDTAHYLSFDKAALPPGSKQWTEPAPGR